MGQAHYIDKLERDRAHLIAALREVERLRLATTEGSLRVRADQMWQIARTAVAQAEAEEE